MKSSMKLVINRKKWYRGRQSGSALLREDGRMCCLGFYALACGIKKSQIGGIATPGSIATDIMESQKIKTGETTLTFTKARKLLPATFIWLVSPNRHNEDSILSKKLMRVNDDSLIKDDKREEKLTRLFKSKGVDVTFTGKG